MTPPDTAITEALARWKDEERWTIIDAMRYAIQKAQEPADG